MNCTCSSLKQKDIKEKEERQKRGEKTSEINEKREERGGRDICIACYVPGEKLRGNIFKNLRRARNYESFGLKRFYHFYARRFVSSLSFHRAKSARVCA